MFAGMLSLSSEKVTRWARVEANCPAIGSVDTAEATACTYAARGSAR